MATYKENPEFLQKCINSVLKQTFQDFEFLIVVEPEDPNIIYLKAIAEKDGRVKIFQNESRLGVAASRNRAIMASSGKYIAIIDGDDYCDSNRFERQLKFFKDNPEISVVGTNMHLVDGNNELVGERKYPELHKDIKRYFLLTMGVGNPTVMVRRKDLEDIGFFNSDFLKAEDLELWLRFLVKHKRMHNLQESLVYYRIQGNQNVKRGNVHWKNIYIARKKYSKFIWPFYQRFLSLFFWFIISLIPDNFLDGLLNLKIVNKIKNISMN
jgi:glycosyltransferase involved in cell wall biosynthesis